MYHSENYVTFRKKIICVQYIFRMLRDIQDVTDNTKQGTCNETCLLQVPRPPCYHCSHHHHPIHCSFLAFEWVWDAGELKLFVSKSAASPSSSTSSSSSSYCSVSPSSTASRSTYSLYIALRCRIIGTLYSIIILFLSHIYTFGCCPPLLLLFHWNLTITMMPSSLLLLHCNIIITTTSKRLCI